MPMLNEATTLMTMKMSSQNIADSATQAQLFAALPLPAEFIYPHSALRRGLLQDYLNALPIGIQESLRATIYLALTSRPPRPMAFQWAGAYDYSLEHTETYDTFNSPRTPGVMGITLRGRYPGDEHPLAARMRPPRSSRRGAAAGKKRAAKRRK